MRDDGRRAYPVSYRGGHLLSVVGIGETREEETIEKELRILILEDVPTDAELMEHELRRENIPFISNRVETREDFIRELHNFTPDLVLADYRLPSFDGLEALAIAAKECPDVPFILVSGALGEERTVEILKSGATDYILKDRLSRLHYAVLRALREAEERRDRKKAERALLTAAQEWRSTFDAINNGICLLNQDGRILRCNIAMQRLFGKPFNEILGQKIWRLLNCKPDSEECPIMHIKKTKLREASECFLNERWFHITADPMKDESGELIGAVYIIGDITDRKRMEQALQKAHDELEHRVEERTIELSITNDQLKTEIEVRKQAEEALKKLTIELKRSNTDLKDFAYVASHDLKKPLQSIEGFAKLLARRYKDKLDTKADEFIEYIVNGIQRMQGLIKDLLEYSQVEVKGKKFKPTDCSGVVERAVGNLQAAIEESNAVVTYDELPTVMVDTPQMISLFQNLIDNAIKFRSEKAPRIHISAERKVDEWVFSTRDNGIGIDPKDSERIFGMYYRLHGSTDYPGTGIGLAICKKIIERHGGRIWVESEIGKGSTFYFAMPCM